MTKNQVEKYFVNTKTIGKLDPKAFKEIGGGQPKPKTEKNNVKRVPTLTEIRDSMGWPAKDITKNEIVVEDRVIQGHIMTRTYRKKDLQNKMLPVLFYIHGGGFFGGSIENVEQICRMFADGADLMVVSIGYRLTPQHPFPAGLLDCYNTVEYFATNANKELVDSENFFISGDSAGGNLSITVSLLDHVYLQTKYLRKIVAYYPVVELLSEGEGKHWDVSKVFVKDKKERELVHRYIKGFGKQDTPVNDWYAGKIDKKNPLISPFFATDEQLKQLPELKIIMGEFDPLKLQVDYFVERLETLAIPCEYRVYNGMVHAFMDKMGDYPQAEQGVEEAVDFLLS